MITINPLDRTNEVFDFAGMNPNPSFANLKDGPVYRISFEIDEELWKLFVAAKTKGMVVGARMFVCSDGGEQEVKPVKPEKGPYGGPAQSLYREGFFMNPHVREVLGTDEQYQAWTRLQPCIITGDKNYTDEYPEGICEFAHVRRSGEAGTGIKPEYSGVPMTHAAHALQHEHGETLAYRQYLDVKNKPEGMPTVQDSKDWFEKKAANNLYRWAREQLCNYFKYDSLTHISPQQMWAWASEHGIEKYLPNSYKEHLK